MSRKDYEIVAASIAEARADHKCTPNDTFGIDIAETLARNFARENSRFNTEIFLRACGFSEHVIGPQ